MTETDTETQTTVRRGVPVDPVHWAEVMGYSAGHLQQLATTCTLREPAEIARWATGYLFGWRTARNQGKPRPARQATRAGANWLPVEIALLEQGSRGGAAQVELGAMLDRPPGAIKVEASRRGLTPRSARSGDAA